MNHLSFSIHEYSPVHNDLVMVWVNDGEYACIECVPKEIAQFIVYAKDALVRISNGDGCYSAQAFEYKNIARSALGLPCVGKKLYVDPYQAHNKPTCTEADQAAG